MTDVEVEWWGVGERDWILLDWTGEVPLLLRDDLKKKEIWGNFLASNEHTLDRSLKTQIAISSSCF